MTERLEPSSVWTLGVTLVLAVQLLRAPDPADARIDARAIAAVCLALGSAAAIPIVAGDESGGPFDVLVGFWVVAADLCLLTLGTAFTLLPTRSTLVRRGPYAVVRHPAYACEILAAWTWALGSMSLGLALVAMVFTVAQLVRIAMEEDLLAGDPAYVDYQIRVPWRLLPGVA